MPGSGPATQLDLRNLRRWVLVAGVWAVAATAVALIALLDTSGDDAQRSARGAADRASSLGRRQKQLGKRLDALDARVGGLAPTSDVSVLEARLGRAEQEASAAKKDAADASGKVIGLAERVGSLEDEPPPAADSGGSVKPNTREPAP